MTGSNEVLDTLFEAWPHDITFGASIYPPRGERKDSELYVDIEGECWRVLVTRHPHRLS